MRRTFDCCPSTREYLAFLTLLPARPPEEEIDVCPAAKSCPFDRTHRSANMRSSANAAGQGPAIVSPRWGGASSQWSMHSAARYIPIPNRNQEVQSVTDTSATVATPKVGACLNSNAVVFLTGSTRGRSIRSVIQKKCRWQLLKRPAHSFSLVLHSLAGRFPTSSKGYEPPETASHRRGTFGGICARRSHEAAEIPRLFFMNSNPSRGAIQSIT